MASVPNDRAWYAGAHHRIVSLVRELPPTALHEMVPACPKWTVRDLLAHLCAVARSARDAGTSGRLPSIPTPEQTQVGVDERANATLDQVLDEWAATTEELTAILSPEKLRSQVVHDITQHEADVRGTVGAQR
ncbi:MAG: maleylpyruvate isomerase N-terminal domain-containing protein, partial [Sciscionella sp.]|nr:maleylpyruvate isomerase N-terminal domain-containing protein [Sciscionella sp.]